jgi:trehalose 6-phosphate synthase
MHLPMLRAALTTMERERFVESLTSQLAGRKLVVVSNREPVVHVRHEDRVDVLTPASGLTTALAPIVSACGGTWVAHGSGTADFDVTDSLDKVQVAAAELGGDSKFWLKRVRLSKEIEEGYYYGYANEGLWPLCHVAYTAPIFRQNDWEAYSEANRLFADAILKEVGGSQNAIVLVNDFHLGLVPRMLREARPDLLLAQFWHVPWPSQETTRVCPQLQLLLSGMLGNDLLGFHVEHHCNNFLGTVDRSIEALVDWEHHSAQHRGHRTFVRSFPISIDVQSFTRMARARSFESEYAELAGRVQDRRLLLGVDRLDYTKGIPHRLQMIGNLLASNPQWRERVVFVQVGAPSRTVIPRYRALACEVQELVDEINDRFATPNWRPVEYLSEHQDRSRVAVLMRRAEACLVTPLHDGMNLVAKEYVAARAGLPGTLVLSKFTGAARELPEACLINPYDVDGSADLILQSLRMPEEQRADAMRVMLQHITRNNVYRWSYRLFRSLDEVARRSAARVFPGN